MKTNASDAMRWSMSRTCWSESSPVIHLLVAAMMVGCLIFATGCVAYRSCDDFDEHEYCVGNDCECGLPCSMQSCVSGRTCVGYSYEPTHGVCVTDAFQREYELPLIGETAPANNQSQGGDNQEQQNAGNVHEDEANQDELNCGYGETVVEFRNELQCMPTCESDFHCGGDEECHEEGVCVPEG